MTNAQIIEKLKPTYLNDTQDTFVELVKVVDYEKIPMQVSKKQLMTCQLKGSKDKYFFVAELENIVPTQLLREYQSKYVTLLVNECEIK